MLAALSACAAFSVGLLATLYVHQYGELEALKNGWRESQERKQVRVKQQRVFEAQLTALRERSSVLEADNLDELERIFREELASRVKGEWLSSAHIGAKHTSAGDGLWMISLDIEAEGVPSDQVVIDLAMLQQKTPKFAIMQLQMQTIANGGAALPESAVELHATVLAFGEIRDGRAGNK